MKEHLQVVAKCSLRSSQGHAHLHALQHVHRTLFCMGATNTEREEKEMNGYQMHIDAYRSLLEKDREDMCDADKEYIRAQIKALEPFAERTEEERRMMFDTGAFNDVLKSYCKVAMQNCDIDDKVISQVLEEVAWLLDTVCADKILKR